MNNKYNNRDNRMRIMKKRESKTTKIPKNIYQANINNNNSKNNDQKTRKSEETPLTMRCNKNRIYI